MALFIPGMHCAICAQPVASSNEAVLFPPFCANKADPLYILSDAVIHEACGECDPRVGHVKQRLEEAKRKTSDRRCLVCGETITDYEDYVAFGFLIDDHDHPLYRYNYVQFHRMHLSDWNALQSAISHIEELDASEGWMGDSLKQLLTALRSAAASNGSVEK